MSWPIVWTQIEHLDTSLRVITAYFVKSIEHLDTSMYVKHIRGCLVIDFKTYVLVFKH